MPHSLACTIGLCGAIALSSRSLPYPPPSDRIPDARLRAVQPLGVAAMLAGRTTTAVQPAGPLATGHGAVVHETAHPLSVEAAVQWRTRATADGWELAIVQRLDAMATAAELATDRHCFELCVTAPATDAVLLTLVHDHERSPGAIEHGLRIDLGADGSFEFDGPGPTRLEVPCAAGGSVTIALQMHSTLTGPAFSEATLRATLQVLPRTGSTTEPAPASPAPTPLRCSRAPAPLPGGDGGAAVAAPGTRRERVGPLQRRVGRRHQ
jgi:hypothetical protein